MRNLKKLLAVIVAVCTILTFTVPAFAAESASISADAQIAKDLGVLKGDSSLGVTDTYLAKGTTRLQAATLELRLLGKEQAAYDSTPASNFADADKAGYANGQKLMGYLKDHPELGWTGVGADKFGPQDAASAQMLYKVALEVLGYSCKNDGTGDFKYADTFTFAATKGLSKAADVAKLTNDGTATILVEALKATVKGGTDTLVAKLVAAGSIDRAAAVAAGLVADKATATVAATGAKELTVTFNQAVDTSKAAITVKKGTVTVSTDSVVFAADKKSAVVTTTTNLTKGDYTVTVSGLGDAITATVTAADQKVSKINITSVTAPRLATTSQASVTYEVLDQYGDKMTGVSVSWTISTGKAAIPVSDGKFTIVSADNNAFVPGAVVYITGVHATSGTVVNGQVTIGLEAQPDAVVFKGVYDKTKSKLADLPAGFAANRYVLLFETNDQYGNKIASPDLNKLVFTSNNPVFVGSTFTTDSAITLSDVEYQAVKLTPGSISANGGTVVISAISTVTGKTSSYTITADASAAVKTFTMSAPASIIAEGEHVTIPYTAVDQYGNAVTSYDDLNTKVTFTPAFSAGVGIKFVEQNDGSAKLVYYAPATGANADTDLPVYLTSLVTNGGSFSSQLIYVKETAVPTAIIGIDPTSNKSTSIAVGNHVDLKAADFVIQDQYGRTMDDDTVTSWFTNTSYAAIVVTSTKPASNDVSAMTVSSSSLGIDATFQAISTTAQAFTVAPKTTGTGLDASEQLVFAISNTAVPAAIAGSEKSVTFTKVQQSAYTSYEVKDLGTMYNNGQTSTQTAVAWDKDVTVYGILADGTKVTLPTSEYTIATDSSKLTVSGVTISDVAAGGYDHAADFVDNAGNAKNVTVDVLVTVNDSNGAAAAILEKTLTLSDIDPKIVTVAFDSDVVTDGSAEVVPTSTGAITAADLLAAIDRDNTVDQYGVTSTDSTLVPVAITITNLTKVDDSTLTVTSNGTASVAIANAMQGDKFTVTYKYAGGTKVSVNYLVGIVPTV